MTQQQHKTNSRAKRPAEPRGSYKLGIWFIIHQGDKAKYLYSTKRQDMNNNQFVRKFKEMILNGSWAGKVSHATFYCDGVPFLRYTDQEPVWSHTNE